MVSDQLYLVPARAAPMVATWRRFVCVAASFVGGSALGAASGYAVARSFAEAAPAPAPPHGLTPDGRLAPSGNGELDELRWLAVEAPIEELATKNAVFFMMLDRTYRTDPVLWRGVARLCREALGNERSPHRRMIALLAVPIIEHDQPPAELRLEELLPRLRVASRR
jgi:hypothetical protein